AAIRDWILMRTKCAHFLDRRAARAAPDGGFCELMLPPGPSRVIVSSISRRSRVSDYIPHLKLTHEGALKMLRAGIAKALELKQPQCITITDDGGHLLAFVRMDGAKVLSIDSSRKKAMTAASARAPSGQANVANEVKLAFAT